MALSDQRDFMRVDEYGFDPLLDDSYEAIESVQTYRTHTVKAEEAGNPALIAFTLYRNAAWWRALMVYNGIADAWDIVAGTSIRIPDVNEMTTNLQRAKAAGTQIKVVKF